MAKDKKPKEDNVDLGELQALVETSLAQLDKLTAEVEELKKAPAPAAAAPKGDFATLEAKVAKLQSAVNTLRTRV